MKSVPPRGSGWVLDLTPGKCRKSSARIRLDTLASMRPEPTRYRVAVLTSSRRRPMSEQQSHPLNLLVLTLMRLDKVEVAPGSFHHQCVRVGVVIFAAKLTMVHKPQVHALTGSLIERCGHRDTKTRDHSTALIALSGIRNVREMRGNGQVGLQLR